MGEKLPLSSRATAIVGEADTIESGEPSANPAHEGLNERLALKEVCHSGFQRPENKRFAAARDTAVGAAYDLGLARHLR